MNNKKRMGIILVFVLILAIFFQGIRTDIMLKLFKNINPEYNSSQYAFSQIKDELKKEKMLIIFDETEQSSVDLKNNLLKTLEYMKKDVEVIEVKKALGYDSKNEAVILTFEAIDKINNINLLKEYVSNGGNLFIAERPLEGNAFNNITEMLGIESYNDIVDSKGIRMLSNVLIKGTGLKVEEKLIFNSSIDLKLNKNTETLIESLDSVPILWRNAYNKGNIIVYNGTTLAEKINRGLIVGAISMLIPNYIYPIMNAKLTYIDDFPAPIPEGYNEEIYNEYGLSVPKFYREIWWPDILRGIKLYNLKYTGLIIETYENSTTPPFDNKQYDSKQLLIYGRELLKNGGELGIHGFNHQSLAPENYIKQDLGYNPWRNIEDMKASLKEVFGYSKASFPEYDFRVYVPPSNILSNEGREAVKSSIPSIKIISSIYTEHFLGDAYDQEFEVKEDMVEMPRLTYGYSNNDETQWNMYNGLTSLGVFSHFIHPDDVLDSKRTEGKSWSDLIKEYDSILNEVNDKFSWVPPVTASEGAKVLKDYINLEPFVEYKDNKINITCKNFKEDASFILRSEGKIKSNQNFESSQIDDGIYIIKAKKPCFSIEISR